MNRYYRRNAYYANETGALAQLIYSMRTHDSLDRTMTRQSIFQHSFDVLTWLCLMYQLNATGNNEWLDWNVLLCIKFIWIYITSKVWTEIILQMQAHWYRRASAVIYDWVFYQSVIGQFVVVGKRFAVAFRVWIQLNTLKVFCVRTRRLSSSSIVITDFHLSLHTFTSLLTMFTPTLVSTKSHKLSLKII